MERPRLITALGSLALGAGLGLGLMFLLDPQLGRGRRARLGERLRRGTGAGGRAIAGAGSVAQGSRELAAALRARLGGSPGLEERVRAHIEQVASAPDAIEVEAEGGVVRLSGWVPLDEIDDVVAEVAAVAGVREIENLLQVELPPPHVPGEH